MRPIIITHGIAIGPVTGGAAKLFDPGMFIRRHRLAGELPAQPVGRFGQYDAHAITRRGQRGGTASDAPADDGYIALNFRRLREERKYGNRNGLTQKITTTHSSVIAYLRYDTSVNTMKPNRRSFLLASGMSALAASRAAGANDTIRLGAIGCGGRMRGDLNAADVGGGFDLVAGCDVYEPRRDEIRDRSHNLASTHIDYRELLDKKDIDAVLIAAPDHWHVRMACDALEAGKDVYLEKPVTHTLEESATLINAVRNSKRILQSGMQQRSWSHFQDAVDLIQGGSLGRVTRIRTFWFQNYQSPPAPETSRSAVT